MNFVHSTKARSTFSATYPAHQIAFLFTFILSMLLSPSLASAQLGLDAGARLLQGSAPSTMAGDTWDDLGGGVTGMDAVVTTLLEHDGFLYAGGVFEQAGGENARNIARFNLTTSQWEAMGIGTDNAMATMVNDIAVHGGLIYVGGSFTQMNGQNLPYLAVYNPSTEQWSSIGSLNVDDFTNVFALHVFGDDLYVGGEFQEIDGLEVSHLARYNFTDQTWHRVGTYTPSDPFDVPFMDATVMRIDGNDTDLVFGGFFTVAGATEVNGVVRYTPGTETWTPLGDGLGDFGALNDVAMGDGVVYVAGFFADEVENLGVYSIAGESWTSIGNGFNNTVVRLLYHNGLLFAGGDFTDFNGSAGVAVYDPGTENWSTFGTGLTSFGGMFSGVVSLGIAEGKLVAGGVVDDAGGVPINNIARWSGDFGDGGGDGGGGGDGDGGGPVTFLLQTPTNEAGNVSVEPLFTWDAPIGVDVDYYILEIFENEELDGFPFFINFDMITEPSYDYGENMFNLPLLQSTTYYWRVSAFDDQDDLVALSAEPFSFTTVGDPVLVAPTLVDPSAENVSLTPTFVWSQVDDATGYTLTYYATEDGPGSATVIELDIDDEDLEYNDPDYSYTLPLANALLPETGYTWMVTATADGLDPETSDPATFTTMALPPSAFNLASPANMDTDVPRIPTFTWEQSDGAVTYTLQLSTTNNFDAPIYQKEFIGLGDDEETVSFEYDGDELAVFRSYYWQVLAVGPGGETPSGSWQFRTVFDREIALISPVDDTEFPSTNAAISADYIWPHIFSDADEGEGNYFYTIEPLIENVMVVSTGLSGVVEGENFKGNMFNGPSHGFRHSWIVWGHGTYDGEQTDIIYSDRLFFTIDPETPEIVGQDDNTELEAETAFEWLIRESIQVWGGDGNITGKFEFQLLFNNDPDADPSVNADDGYHFLVDASTFGDPDSHTITLQQLVDSNNEVSLADIFGPEDQTMFWRVRIHPEYEEFEQDRVTLWSALTSVFVPKGPAPITLLSPGDDDDDTPQLETLRPTFEWEALEDVDNVFYHLELSKQPDFGTLFGSVQTTQQTLRKIDFTLDGNATYYWQVKATVGEDGQDLIGQSPVRSFSIGNILIEVVSLADGATNIGFDDVFEWYSNSPQFTFVLQGQVINQPGVLYTMLSSEGSYTLSELIENRLPLEGDNHFQNVSPDTEYMWTVSLSDAEDEFLGTSGNRTFTTGDLVVSPFASGSGEADDPYVITDVHMLQAMKDYLSSHFELGNDIDASETKDWEDGAGFEPVGFSSNRFTGNFDGKGFVITDLWINRPTLSEVGLFGSIGSIGASAKLENIRLEGVNINGRGSVGALVGYALMSTISNSTVTGSVIGSIHNTGGLVGYAEQTLITNSHAICSVTGSTNVGGLVGFQSNSEISNSYSSGSVTGQLQLGGLVGEASISSTIENSYSRSSIDGMGIIGGLVGYVRTSNVRISNSFSTGSVNATTNERVGGLIGENGSANITNSFWDQETSSRENSAGGTGLSTNLMKKRYIFTNADWNFDDNWFMNSEINDGYPALRAFYDEIEEDHFPTQLAIISDERSFNSGGISDIITVELQDAQGEAITSIGTTTVTFTSDPIHITFRNEDNTVDITEAIISEGQSQVSFRATGMLPGTKVMTIMTQGLPSVAQDITITGDLVGSPFASGSGEADNPFVITDVHMLQAMKDYPSLHFVLGNDIDASETKDWEDGAGFEPVGTLAQPFTGKLDGKGFVITYLWVKRPDSYRIGLFSTSNSGAKLVNVRLERVNIEGRNQVGGLVGLADNTMITDSYVNGSVGGNSEVGGLVGAFYSSTITNSHASGSLTGTSRLGGLVGILTSGSTIEKSFTISSVNGTTSVGGLVGDLRFGSTIENSFARTSVNGDNRVGGLVGTIGGEISNSYATGLVRVIDNSRLIFGLIGINTGTADISNSFWDIETSNQQSSVGGTGKSTADMKKFSTYYDAGWDFESIWMIHPTLNDGYPILQGVGDFMPETLVNRPELGTPVESDMTIFSWTGDETAGFVFEIHDDLDELVSVGPGETRETDIIHEELNAPGLSLELGSWLFEDGKTYYWRVSAKAETTPITYVTSSVGVFSPAQTPDVITTVLPLANPPLNTISGITFTWEPDEYATSYQILVYESDASGDPDLENPIIDHPFTLGTNGDLSYTSADEITFIYGRTYLWRVIGINGTKMGKLNDLSRFSIQSARLVVKTFGQIQVNNVAFTPEPGVQILDGSNNVITSMTPTVTLSASTGVTMQGPLSVIANAGSASFNGISATGTDNVDHTLTFNAPGFVPVSKYFRLYATAASAASAKLTLTFKIDVDTANDEVRKAFAKAICESLNLISENCQRVSITTVPSSSKQVATTANSETLDTNQALLPVIWGTPQDDEFIEFPITDFALQYRETGTEAWTMFARTPSVDTLAVITGLKSNTSYDVRVAPINQNGVGQFTVPVDMETIELQEILDFIDEVAELITTSIEIDEIPKEITLYQNYPNPFNPTTTIRYALPELAEVRLEVYNMLGQRVAVLVQGQQPAGWHNVQLDASRWSSGAYIYRLQAGDRVMTKKLLLIK